MRFVLRTRPYFSLSLELYLLLLLFIISPSISSINARTSNKLSKETLHRCRMVDKKRREKIKCEPSKSNNAMPCTRKNGHHFPPHLAQYGFLVVVRNINFDSKQYGRSISQWLAEESKQIIKYK